MNDETKASEAAGQSGEGKEVSVKKVAPARTLSPFEEMDRMFERVFPRSWLQPLRWEWPSWSDLEQRFETRAPRVDVIDREEEIVVHAEIPGVDKEDLDVSMTEDTVTIKGTTRTEEKEEKGDYYRCEISRGSFARTVTLPVDVDGSQAKASFKDGVLELKLPKIEASKRRRIKVE